MVKIIDISPNPRILRVLGDIPFDIWQCLAELSDNSLDSFRNHDHLGQPIANARVDIHWSDENTPSRDREIVVEDNGPGMSIEQLQDAARAGFSSNDPVHSLGLFGMGFNISTARLGDETLFLSATKESDKWIGIKINFDELIKSQSFVVPVVAVPKNSPEESGTRVIVSKLKSNVFSEISRRATSIRKRLEVIYAPIIDREDVEIYFRGKKLRSRPHCVWSETRYVVRRSEKIPALLRIDRDLGETWFDTSKNRYLSEDEAAKFDLKESKGESVPVNLVKRARRLKGWVGIQRYSDTSNFGIDFVRNGRKILVAEKSLFSFENPDTGSFVPEYPIELGSTMGGRIVGELHADYLVPTYQKNSFDTTDIAWRLTIEAIRGAGPILPKNRNVLGYDGNNDSPLGILVSAYRRLDPGTKNLSLPSAVAKEFKKKFENSDPDYTTDDKWYKAAKEADKEKGGPKSPVDPGDTPTDDPEDYAPSPTDDNETGTSQTPSPTEITTPKIFSGTTTRDYLIEYSERMEQQCAGYSYNETPALRVTVRKTTGAQIKTSGTRIPFITFQNGIEIDFFYDETHPLMAEYPITPRQLLLMVLADKFALRDQPGISAPEVFVGLVENHLEDERINPEALKERARAILYGIQQELPSLLAPRVKRAIDIVKEVESEEEALAEILLEENPNLLQEYQSESDKAHEVLAYIPLETLIRLVDKMPEEFLDDKIFTLPYQQIGVGTEDAKRRLRRASVDKIVNYLRDIRSLLKGSGVVTKYELIRYSNTLSILEDRLV